ALGKRRSELEQAGYHVQVEQTAAASMLFLQRAAVRQGIRRNAAGGWLVGDEPIADAELQTWVRQHPDQVSPAALLRPVLQDAAFPSVAQVTGPAETAYLAQSSVLYAALNLPQPVAWPRASLTLLDAKAQRLLEKYHLTLDALFAEPATELLARQMLPAGIERAAAALRENFESGYAALAAELQRLDPTLEAAGQGAAAKILHQLEQLEAKVARSFGRRSEELAAQARHLDASLYPNRHLQERLLATAGWVARHPDLLGRLHEELDPTRPGHQLIAL
ncbi:MAG: bacillithiol biosynthesis protein BshC, partial [Terriglobales bacterium]